MVKWNSISSKIIRVALTLYVSDVGTTFNLHNLDIHAATPAAVTQNDTVDDDEDEPLNEDDDDELDDVDQGEDLNTTHLVLAQFDKVAC